MHIWKEIDECVYIVVVSLRTVPVILQKYVTVKY